MDLGRVSEEDKSRESSPVPQKREDDVSEAVTATLKIGKSYKVLKETGQSTASVLTKFTSQIKKPPHRKYSPINWFPRKKVDSYLNRKIKLLQEVGGMNSTLDETLGDSNPHYSRVLREKIAAKEAAQKAMEARKAAMVEASWCRILNAARIPSKEAETLLFEAEKSVAEAFEAAAAKGVVMYDMPNCSQKACEIETSSCTGGGGSTTHTVAASFETAFDVDKEVAAAVKTAFVRLAHCPSFSKEEFKDVLWKISQNPDMSEKNEVSCFSSENELDRGSELEMEFQKDGLCSQESKSQKSWDGEIGPRRSKRQVSENFNTAKLVDVMLERIKCLKEDELASLATIVATCGLNAALAEAETNKMHTLDPPTNYAAGLTQKYSRRMSSFGTAAARSSSMQYFMDGQMKTRRAESQLPGLGECLVKHMSKLEREILEAKNTRRKSSVKSGEIADKYNEKEIGEGKKNSGEVIEMKCKNLDSDASETVPDFGSVQVNHSSNLDNEKEAKRKCEIISENNDERFCRMPSGAPPLSHRKEDEDVIVPSLDKFLVKHVSRLEREVQEAKSRSKNCLIEGGNEVMLKKKNDSFAPVTPSEENIGLHKEAGCHTEHRSVPALDKFLVKHVSRLEREVQEAKNKRKTDAIEGGERVTWKKKIFSPITHSGETFTGKENIDLNKEVDDGKELGELCEQVEQENFKRENMRAMSNFADSESLDKVLVKHISRLEKEKQRLRSQEEVLKVKRSGVNKNSENAGSLDQILVKHKSKLEREKMAAAQQPEEVLKVKSMNQRSENAGGLDQILVKHKSKLEREKMAAAQQPEEVLKVKRSGMNQSENAGGLDQILVKHKSKLEREKMAAAQQPEDQVKFSVTRREARERELREAWGGLSLGNSIRPHLSKLERDKAAWIKAAEEEERRQAVQHS